MQHLSKTRIQEIISAFNQTSIMVIGDIMLDEYLVGDVHRISPEAPVPVLSVNTKTYRLGGAANVINNLRSIGIKTHLISLCGEDEAGFILRNKILETGCTVSGLMSFDDRVTTLKTRVMASQQQIVRVDREDVRALTYIEIESLWNAFITELPDVHGVIISDYAKGVISPSLIKRMLTACYKAKKFVALDPKDENFHLYTKVNLLTPNLKEAHAALSLPYSYCTDGEIEKLGWEIIKKYDLPTLLITLSERGMALFERENKTFYSLPTVAQKVFDVTGAGDTVISTYTAAIIGGATPFEAACLSNHAAGLTVAKIGTASVTQEELLGV